jgi:hypothetical protein
MWSQASAVTGRATSKLSLVLLRSVGAAGAASRDLLLGVLGPEALASDLDEVRPMGQPIEGGRSQQRFAEELGPLGAVAIRGQQNGAPFISLVDDVVQIFGAGGPEALEPEIVEDQQRGAGVAGQPLLMGAVGAAARFFAASQRSAGLGPGGQGKTNAIALPLQHPKAAIAITTATSPRRIVLIALLLRPDRVKPDDPI